MADRPERVVQVRGQSSASPPPSNSINGGNQRRGPPPRGSRFNPRAYGGGGFFKRERHNPRSPPVNQQQQAPGQGQGQGRSRSRSPRSAHSRSRSRSFSPRGNRTYQNWERDGAARAQGGGQPRPSHYQPRKGDFYEPRGRERERERERGGGASRYQGYGRQANSGSNPRNMAREQRFGPSQGGAFKPPANRRSASRDRSAEISGSDTGSVEHPPVSGSFRDRQMRDRERRMRDGPSRAAAMDGGEVRSSPLRNDAGGASTPQHIVNSASRTPTDAHLPKGEDLSSNNNERANASSDAELAAKRAPPVLEQDEPEEGEADEEEEEGSVVEPTQTSILVDPKTEENSHAGEAEVAGPLAPISSSPESLHAEISQKPMKTGEQEYASLDLQVHAAAIHGATSSGVSSSSQGAVSAPTDPVAAEESIAPVPPPASALPVSPTLEAPAVVPPHSTYSSNATANQEQLVGGEGSVDSANKLEAKMIDPKCLPSSSPKKTSDIQSVEQPDEDMEEEGPTSSDHVTGKSADIGEQAATVTPRDTIFTEGNPVPSLPSDKSKDMSADVEMNDVSEDAKSGSNAETEIVAAKLESPRGSSSKDNNPRPSVQTKNVPIDDASKQRKPASSDSINALESDSPSRTRRRNLGEKNSEHADNCADIQHKSLSAAMASGNSTSAASPTSFLREEKPLARRVSMSAMPQRDWDNNGGRSHLHARESRVETLSRDGSTRPGLERHSSFTSGRLERSSPQLSRSHSTSSPMKQHIGLDGMRARRLDEAFSEVSVHKEARRSSLAEKPGVPTSDTRSKEPVQLGEPREELPALPDIPRPDSSALRGSLLSDSETMFNLTPTKTSKRPRLGWGQGLVASSPPQPPKRPRIGWGEGLMQQSPGKASPSASARDMNGGSPSVAAGTTEVVITPVKVSDGGTTVAADAIEVGGTAAAVVSPEKAEGVIIEESVKPADEGSNTKVVSELPAGDVVMQDAESRTQPGVDGDVVMSTPPLTSQPSKEEILATIDTLDSNISDLKKHIKELQSNITEAETSGSTSALLLSIVKPAAAEEQITNPAELPNNTSDVELSQTVSTKDVESTTDDPDGDSDGEAVAPVKVGVDSMFVELITGIFSENMRRAATANARVPKRLEDGVVATKLYYQPSDYPFYQSNIDRGASIADAIRIKVRKRNRARHEHVKMLAREYLDLKKEWKQRVKKMEKDRKRQEKQRNKLKMKNAQKNGAEGTNGAVAVSPSHFTSVHTTHQNPHVQQILAASGGAIVIPGSVDGAPGSGVRSSSRLTNNSSAELQTRNDLEKIEQAKAQALLDQEVRKKRLKNALTTVIPDMLLTSEERRARYFARVGNGQSCMANGLVKDWKKRERAQMIVNPWSDLEKCIFVDKFLQYPKNFARISFALSNKTTGDVIAFYYRSKKVIDYKALLREQQLRRRGAGSKNTWSCWNLTACAAICLGVKFPVTVAKLLLHPSNFRSHQASDNILNSAGARLMLQEGNSEKDTNDAPSTRRRAVPTSALDIASTSNRALKEPLSTPPVVLDEVVASAGAGSTDTQKFDLYTQRLSEFVAGQQQPFLVNFANYFNDNSFSTGYEVSTLPVAERLKQYNLPSSESVGGKNTSKLIDASTSLISSAKTPNGGEETKGKHNQATAAKHPAGTHVTKKEMKQQRKQKKLQDNVQHNGTNSSAVAGNPVLSTAGEVPVASLSQSSTSSQGRGRKGGSSTSGNGNTASNRASPRAAPSHGDEKQSGRKGGKNGGGATPSARRNSAGNSGGSIMLPIDPSAALAAAVKMSTSDASAGVAGAAAVITTSDSGDVKPPLTVDTTLNPVGVNGQGGSTPLPSKRVVQKWTDAEKADFLKFFSVRTRFSMCNANCSNRRCVSGFCLDVWEGLVNSHREYPHQDGGPDQKLLPELQESTWSARYFEASY